MLRLAEHEDDVGGAVLDHGLGRLDGVRLRYFSGGKVLVETAEADTATDRRRVTADLAADRVQLGRSLDEDLILSMAAGEVPLVSVFSGDTHRLVAPHADEDVGSRLLHRHRQE